MLSSFIVLISNTFNKLTWLPWNKY
jgi:hypothetical protein